MHNYRHYRLTNRFDDGGVKDSIGPSGGRSAGQRSLTIGGDAAGTSTPVPMAVNQSNKRLKPTVDLSRIDSSLVAQIASFVGTARELLNLALTCKSFGGRPPGWALDWSLAEEVAREAVCSGRNDTEGVHVTLSQYGRGITTWLAVLHESENPLKFDTLWGGECVTEYRDGRRTKVIGKDNRIVCTAVASNYEMQSGIHYAEFHITGAAAIIGIVRPLNLSPERYANRYFNFFDRSFYGDFLASRTDNWGSGIVHLCDYSSAIGTMRWTNWDVSEELRLGLHLEWEGMERCKSGDTVGMLLDLDAGTLSVYKNNRRLGVMKDGLDGSYCWFVGVWRGKAVPIKRGQPPRV